MNWKLEGDNMTTKTALLKAIRTHCLECCGGSYQDVENCTAGPNARSPNYICGLWDFRLGKDPEGPSEAMKEKGRRMSASRQKAPNKTV